MRVNILDIRKVLLAVCLLIVIISFVYAVPTEPTAPQSVTRLEDERYNVTQHGVPSLEAEAGNVTKIELFSLAQTQTWQGFYGEIEGTITLDDAQNWTMYDWDMAEPQGEIYAAPTTISNWDTVHCLNYTAHENWCVNLSANATADGWMQGTFATLNFTLCNYTMNASGNMNFTHAYNYTWDAGNKTTWTTSYINLSLLENSTITWSLGLASNDYDGVDETFNESGTITANYTGGANYWVNHTAFWVGTIEITGGTCPATDMYETVCMNVTDADRKDQIPFFWTLNHSGGIPEEFENETMCDLFSHNENYFLINGTIPNSTSLFNLTLSGAEVNDVNLSGQKFKYMASEYGINFQEVLLSVNNSDTVIYATIIENDQIGNRTDVMGFDNTTHDFQMIVGDDGHPGDKQDTTTQYYFYVEIE